MTATRWIVEHHRGSAAAFHHRELPPEPDATLWWFEVTRPALVLGSTQDDGVVDRSAIARTGTELVRRRSGGGAVHLVPGAVTWVDVLLPATDPRWRDDVGLASHWVGRAWAAALAELGVSEATVHEGPMVRTRWSAVACFAGLGPGEVTVDGRKVVGISQRRTRLAARFQCALIHRWEPAGLVDLLALGAEERVDLLAALAAHGGGVGPLAPPAVIAALRRAVEDPATR